MTTLPGRFIQLQRLAKGTIFHLSAAPADAARCWRVMRHEADGRTRCERLHNDKTARLQTPLSTLMVFVPADEEELMSPEEMDELERELEEPYMDALDAPDTISIDPLLDEELI